MTRFQALKNEGTEQDLATGVEGTVLLGLARLESGALRIELGEALFDRLAGHGVSVRSVVGSRS